MNAAKLQIVGEGLKVARSHSHPAGTMFSGGYDSNVNTLFLASVVGHPRGVSLAGGDPSSADVSGLRILIVELEQVYWASDSMSLPRALSQQEFDLVQAALEDHFGQGKVLRVEKLEDIPN
jgi:hypothetical protein